MIDEVIICGVKRAREPVEIGEIKQAIGRAGRSYEKSGKAIVLCPSSDMEYAEKCLFEETNPVKSELVTVPVVAFHVLPWVDRVYDEDSFKNWYSHSLASVQGGVLEWKDVMAYLLDAECIDNECNITEFGRISVRMYYSPDRLLMMKERLLEAEANDNVKDMLTLSYVFASEHVALSNVEAWELSEYKSSLIGNGYSFEHGELVQGFAYYCAMMGGMAPKWIRHVVSQVRDDLPRLFAALGMMTESEGMKELADEIKLACVMATKKVDESVARTMLDFGLKKRSAAMELQQEFGVYCRDDLKEKENDISDNGSNALLNELQENGFLKDLYHRKLAGNKN